ncbi:receptor-like protein kinase 2, partial [Haematococcus lacustris]
MGKSGLQGSLPASLSKLSQLTFLGLNEDQLTGSIPDAAWATGMASLQFLELSRNQLTGSCPAALLAQTRLRKLD